jgi:hypothetical protein
VVFEIGISSISSIESFFFYKKLLIKEEKKIGKENALSAACFKRLSISIGVMIGDLFFILQYALVALFGGATT